MDKSIKQELERLTGNAAARRKDLMQTGLRKSRIRKALNIVAGILALFSAGAITAVVANIFGDGGVQLIAALVAGFSGTITLFITAYYSDDEILNMLNGASKYLSLRESSYRLVIHPELSDHQRFMMLSELQDEYAKLDETYSRYFSLRNTIEPTESVELSDPASMYSVPPIASSVTPKFSVPQDFLPSSHGLFVSDNVNQLNCKIDASDKKMKTKNQM